MFKKLFTTKVIIIIMLCVAVVSIVFLGWIYLSPQPENMLYAIVDGQTIPHSNLYSKVSLRYLLPPLVGLCFSSVTIFICIIKSFKNKKI